MSSWAGIAIGLAIGSGWIAMLIDRLKRRGVESRLLATEMKLTEEAENGEMFRMQTERYARQVKLLLDDLDGCGDPDVVRSHLNRMLEEAAAGVRADGGTLPAGDPGTEPSPDLLQ